MIIGGWRNHLQKDGGGRRISQTCNAEVETRNSRTPTTPRRISQIPTSEIPVIEVRRGTPQGSLISPLLFNLYIDDLLVSLEKPTNHGTSAYADDLAFLARSEAEVRNAMSIITD